jgi:hypothetical protein
MAVRIAFKLLNRRALLIYDSLHYPFERVREAC